MSEHEEQQKYVFEQLARQNKKKLQKFADIQIKEQELDKRHWRLINYIASKPGNNSAFEFSPMAMQAQERPSNATAVLTIDNKKVEIKYSDMDFMLAENLQMLCASQDPLAEYHDWVATEDKIETAVTTDGTTFGEWKERNDFISFMDERETELKRIISLYSGAAFNPLCREQAAAQAKLKELTFKLKELRRLRERAQNLRPSKPKDLKLENNNFNNYDYASNVAEELRSIRERQLAAQQKYYEEEFEENVTTATHHGLIERRLQTLNQEELADKKTLWEKIMEKSGRNIPASNQASLSLPRRARPRGFTRDDFTYLKQTNTLSNG